MTNKYVNRGKGHIVRLALMLVTVASGANMVRAQGAAAQQAVPNSEIGHTTNQWLALQRISTVAVPAQAMLGAEASLAYKRYLESFNSKIPDLYDSTVNRGGGR